MKILVTVETLTFNEVVGFVRENLGRIETRLVFCSRRFVDGL